MIGQTSYAAKLFVRSLLGLFTLLLAACFLSGASCLSQDTTPQSPSVQLFANQNQADLEGLIIDKIQNAKESILILVYSFTSERIIKNLNKKSSEGIKIEVICDAKACPFLQQKLDGRIKLLKRFTKGLMHLKILVVDQSSVLIGSANFTKDSFKSHGNLVLGMRSQELARYLHAKAETFDAVNKSALFPHQAFAIEGQNIELWFPSDDQEASKKIKALIRSAKKTIKIAMFTWTRFDFAKEIIEAKKRGIVVEIALDRSSAKGASSKVALLLETANVTFGLNKGPGLLHHKFMIIDDHTLVSGSTNWTKAAFTKNDDCFLILHELQPSQKNLLEMLWKKIAEDCGLPHPIKSSSLRIKGV